MVKAWYISSGRHCIEPWDRPLKTPSTKYRICYHTQFIHEEQPSLSVKEPAPSFDVHFEADSLLVRCCLAIVLETPV